MAKHFFAEVKFDYFSVTRSIVFSFVDYLLLEIEFTFLLAQSGLYANRNDMTQDGTSIILDMYGEYFQG